MDGRHAAGPSIGGGVQYQHEQGPQRRVDTDLVPVKPSPREMLCPYDVIDRLGSDVRLAKTPAAVLDRDDLMKTAMMGSANLAPMARRPEDANAAMRSGHRG